WIFDHAGGAPRIDHLPYLAGEAVERIGLAEEREVRPGLAAAERGAGSIAGREEDREMRAAGARLGSDRPGAHSAGEDDVGEEEVDPADFTGENAQGRGAVGRGKYPIA